eukprot:CAMPEP_0205879434 /NCGR_PEP_ID=MMETSP1083-20121108/15396_1 /ASSEMBLY_ACC=CAM_ASM_000430 /TAXON_ID=97485 /ORGANISM="Prymnesium parvum, Strain Texoma1" /LENGTH=124 /DNA_ID=CAMNT_0053242395 /DNA_START=333 /DNA_END=707 /DNA_ORIENTATION=+
MTDVVAVRVQPLRPKAAVSRHHDAEQNDHTTSVQTRVRVGIEACVLQGAPSVYHPRSSGTEEVAGNPRPAPPVEEPEEKGEHRIHHEDHPLQFDPEGGAIAHRASARAVAHALLNAWSSRALYS